MTASLLGGLSVDVLFLAAFLGMVFPLGWQGTLQPQVLALLLHSLRVERTLINGAGSSVSGPGLVSKA